MNNWQEWRCHTDPTDPHSVLRLLVPFPASTNLVVSWQSVVGATYVLERSANLLAVRAFMPIATNIPGQSGTTTYTDPSPTNQTTWYYRVGIAN